jgi:hypothetical protein
MMLYRYSNVCDSPYVSQAASVLVRAFHEAFLLL